MGFAEDTTINVKGMDISPKEVLMAMVKRPVDTFLHETEESVNLPLTSKPCASVEVFGKKNGQTIARQITYFPSLYETRYERKEIFKKFGATNIYVALPAIIGAMISANKKAPTGVISAECIDPELFLKLMADTGQTVKFVEKSIRSVEW
jgi:saccharopine dehydrogenase-like NADP-dependent oxidoreductase